MKKPETKLVGHIMDRLEAEGGWWMKVHGSIFQIAGVPDIIGCWKGRFIAIEAKMPGNGPSLIQTEVIKLLLKAGARAGVAYSVEESLCIRDGYDNE